MAKYIDMGKFIIVESRSGFDHNLNRAWGTFEARAKFGEAMTKELQDICLEYHYSAEGAAWALLRDSSRDSRTELFFEEYSRLKGYVDTQDYGLYEQARTSGLTFSGCSEVFVLLHKGNQLTQGVTPTLMNNTETQ